MFFLSKEQVDSIKEKYPEGTKIELIQMNDVYSTLVKGDKGIVTGVDDVGTVHVKWEKGSSLGLIPYEDEFKIIEEKECG